MAAYREDGESYKSNSRKEKLILSYADNFRRQYRQLYGDRKALFLTPVNEYETEVSRCIPQCAPVIQLYFLEISLYNTETHQITIQRAV